MKISVGKQAAHLNIPCTGGLFTAAAAGRLITLSQLGLQPSARLQPSWTPLLP